MLKLRKYFKPYIFITIVAILFIFIQAMSDLALPDYMSNIVNQGIQQGGIVNAVPSAVRQSTMDKLTLFMSDDDKKEVLNDYTLIDKNSSDYDKYVKQYPTLKKEPIYVLKNIDKSEVDKINPVMGKAFLAVSAVDKMKSSAKDGFITFNNTKIPANMDLFALFAKLPESERQKIADDMNKKFTSLGDNMVIQAAAAEVKAEYKALGVNTDKIQMNYILTTGLIMLLITILSAACSILVGFLGSRVAAGFSRDIRKSLFTRVESFSSEEFDKFSTASLITRTTNDITQIQMLIVFMIRMIFYAPMIGIGGVIRAVGKSASMSWIIALAVIVLLGLVSIVFSIALPKFKSVQKLVDRLNLVARENLAGMMVIRAFNTQEFEENRFDKANRDITNTMLFINRVMITMFPAMMLIMNGVTLLIVWVGAHDIANSSMQVGDMMAFMQYAIQIIFAFLMMSMMFIMIPRASVSASRIAEVLETEPTVVDPKESKKFDESQKGVVEFRNVSYRYLGAEEDAIKNITFKAEPGKTTAIIGSTGSGKSTLVNLIPRFYDATEGQVLVDGVDVKNVKQHDLREKIGYVPQKISLFKGTVMSNIKFGNENATDEEVKKAAEVAQAAEFIERLPDGYDSEISQDATNISGGQKQRLSIARALVKKPEIYIFDDSFSALDFKTDRALRKALKEYTGNSTVIIVAQRISTIMNADQIIVLDDGKIAGIGTHEELMKNCETYREIAYSQLSKEELA
ncbi:ABC transporter ATP-binding protein [Thermoanaerobacterium butyriciformans]|uniref:ATP-binding cassette subfamily B protein n=1 Tax=Thermoanaerobacterium butyriciformans TaxID=1702242 RepID=A0ABS4NEL2_9THEO|nr:ABC transporter ATP-binding protein [Thermoanaerobacterium butyriciformans]MBP2071644.1 ATP-binding cassette subfamily B protein [Thermoanaerobacterium butyriciformans]